MKLPVLFQHYFEHKNLDKNITFWAYLTHHYSDIPHHDGDEARDMQLPFKTHDHSSGFAPALEPPLLGTFRKFSNTIHIPFTIRYNEDFISSAYNNKVWQPPRVLVNI
ncbi:hypothetical protein [Pedobacter sp.]|uniref:hypothetical protein n=1 Tax=Pedobacter sp. TaxID=1411316 RepID=UPI00396C6DAC